MENQATSTIKMNIEAPVERVWRYLSTPAGWNDFLSDIATHTRGKDSIELGDQVQFVIGELSYQATCIKWEKPYIIGFQEQYKAMFPNGDNWSYELQTSFLLRSLGCNTEVVVDVCGFHRDNIMQWVRECGEMGWRQSLFNLKCVIELGLDLRNEIFNYPRLGVFNQTAGQQLLSQHGIREGGNVLHKVYPNSPAALAGLQDGDIITQIDGEPVPTYKDFVRVLSRFYRKNGQARIEFFRDGHRQVTIAHLTYDDRFTGMIDPTQISLEDVAEQRRKASDA